MTVRERSALDAGTHEPAVDDFGNQYLARVEARADVDGLVALHPAAIALAVWPSVTVDMDTPVGREVVRKGEVIKQRLLALLAGDKAEAPE